MSKTTWAEISKGDAVELNGKPWTVAKIKTKGKLVKVTVTDGRRQAKSEVPAKGKVRLATPVREDVGPSGSAQQRWAKPAELKQRGLAPGDPTMKTPPKKAKGGAWSAPATKGERHVEKVLGAVLAGETIDGANWYVQPPDVTTIAAHMALFHPNTYDAAKDEATMLAGHNHEHKMVAEGTARLGVNHWHTEQRPKVAS